jgi:hypothetical protein
MTTPELTEEAIAEGITRAAKVASEPGNGGGYAVPYAERKGPGPLVQKCGLRDTNGPTAWSSMSADAVYSIVSESLQLVGHWRPPRALRVEERSSEAMDGTRFDDLIKRLGTRRLTRLSVLRGLTAGGVAAVTGMRLVAEEAEAADKKGSQKKRKACDCQNADPTTCTTKRLSRRRRKKLLRNNLCAYAGSCRTGVSGCQDGTGVGCSPANNTRGNCPPGQICNTQAICVPEGQVGCSPANNTRGNCPPGQVCNLRAICVTAVGCLNEANPQCSANQFCCPSESERAGECRGTLQAC